MSAGNRCVRGPCPERNFDNKVYRMNGFWIGMNVLAPEVMVMVPGEVIRYGE